MNLTLDELVLYLSNHRLGISKYMVKDEQYISKVPLGNAFHCAAIIREKKKQCILCGFCW